MIRRITIVDLETTGLDPQKDRVIEVAAAVLDLEHLEVCDSFSFLCQADANAAESANGIPVPLLLDAKPLSRAWKALGALLAIGEVATSFNTPFDRSWLPPEIDGARPWLDSQRDVEWPCGTSGKLVEVAARHAVPVVKAHRAGADVDILVRLLMRCDELHRLGRAPHGARALIERAMAPKVTVVTDYGYDPEKNKLAAAAGFFFDGNRYPKAWVRRVLAEEVDRVVEGLAFRVRVERPEAAA